LISLRKPIDVPKNISLVIRKIKYERYTVKDKEKLIDIFSAGFFKGVNPYNNKIYKCHICFRKNNNNIFLSKLNRKYYIIYSSYDKYYIADKTLIDESFLQKAIVWC
jgi:hypothetical protein